MTYSTTTSFNAASGVLSGVLTGAPSVPPMIASVEPVSDVVMSGFADGSASYFGQVRTQGNGNWAMSTASLPAGTHSVVVTADGRQVGSTSITKTGAGPLSDGGSIRSDLQTNNAPRT